MCPNDRLSESEYTDKIDFAINSDNKHEAEHASDFESDFNSQPSLKIELKHETTLDTSDFESEFNPELTDSEVKAESSLDHEGNGDIDTKKKYSKILQQKLKLNKNLGKIILWLRHKKEK